MAKHRTPSQRYHDRVAGRYDGIYENRPYWLLHDEITWSHMKQFLPTRHGAPILDIGCGAGKWGLRLAKSGFEATLTDNSPRMIEQAEIAAAQQGLSNRVKLVVSDFQDLKELSSDSYAFATAQGDPLSLVASPVAAVQALWRVLQPDAVAVCSVDNRWTGIDHYLETEDLEGCEKFLKNGETTWLTSRQEERFMVHMFWPDELRKLFERNGFKVLDLLAKMCLIRQRHLAILEDAAVRRRLAKMELRYGKLPAACGRASHLQIVVRKE